MATDPLKPEKNRAEQVKTDKQYQKGGIRLYDIDKAIIDHISDTIVSSVEVGGEPIKVPVIYGNAERWSAVRKEGFLRDVKGQIQIPLIMLKRNTISPNEAIQNPLNRSHTYPAQSKYSKKHKYDLFSKMSGFVKPVEQYNVTIPDYVTLTYEVVVWTDFTEHMNAVLELFQYATDTYWGDKYGFKFRTTIDSFDNQTEVGDGAQRIIRTTFTLTVNAYLLPEKFDNQPTTQKAYTIKKVLWNITTTDAVEVEKSKFLTKTPSSDAGYQGSDNVYDGGSASDW